MAVKIELYKNDVFDRVISASTPNDGSFAWNPSGIAYGTDYKIKITDLDDLSVTDMSDGDFEIAPPPGVIFLQDIDNLRNNLSSNLTLDQDLDFNDDASYDHTDPDWETKKVAWTTGAGWTPIDGYSGVLDGGEFSISNLFIDDAVSGGLFGLSATCDIVNLALNNVSVTSTNALGHPTDRNIGALLGELGGSGVVNGCSVSGTLTSNYNGGAAQSCGLLIGFVGGTCSIIKSHSSGTVSIVKNSSLGGLIGAFQSSGEVSDCFSITNCSQPVGYTGGLIGSVQTGLGQVLNCYSGGIVSSNNGGGFCGFNSGTISNCFYDTETSGQSDTGKGTPKTTAEMKQQATFTNWNFSTIWNIVEGITYPTLR